jgi:hypothetical protein
VGGGLLSAGGEALSLWAQDAAAAKIAIAAVTSVNKRLARITASFDWRRFQLVSTIDT